MSEALKVTRSCGGCTACCKTHAIPEIEKDAGKWCTHCAIGKGCGIYEKRPEPCRTFVCAWLTGYGSEAERPDKTKVVFDYGFLPSLQSNMGRVYELSEGALGRPFVRQFMHDCFKQKAPLYLIPLSGKLEIRFERGFSPTEGILQLQEEGVKLTVVDIL